VEKLPSQTVINVVEQSPQKVIAADVAASAGVSLSKAAQDLTALASLSQGDIAVSTEGDLIYSFPPNLSSVLKQNSLKFKTQQALLKIWPTLFYVIRVSFGLVLLASLAAIFSTILFLSSSSNSENDRRRDNRSMGGFGGGFWGPSPFDFLYYRPYYGGYYGTTAVRDPEEMGFLESVFSYIFGDGNPNEGLEERRLSLVANMIRENQGSVTAEQLAPYCDDAPPPNPNADLQAYVDESFVLPIVSQLNGEPRVTEEGDIVYVFPELQQSVATTTTSRRNPSNLSSEASILSRAGLRKNASAGEVQQLLNLNGISTRGVYEKKDLIRLLEQALPPLTEREKAELQMDDHTMLQEREYEFSLANSFNRFLAGGLGIVNLFGALYLGNMLSTYAMYGVRLPSYFGLVQAGFPLLLSYAVLFNVIPLVRSLWIKTENEKIRRRNETRRKWKDLLDRNVFGNLGRKLKAARQMGTKMKRLGTSEEEIIFDTKQSMEQMEKVKAERALDEFDKLLEKEEKPFE
jgi:hypothetical protein